MSLGALADGLSYMVATAHPYALLLLGVGLGMMLLATMSLVADRLPGVRRG